MSEDKKRDRKTDEAKRRFGRFWSASIIILVVAIFCGLMWKAGLLDFRSIDEQFAAIDVELAIPDAENAAVFYRRFFRNPKNQNTLYDLNSHTPSAYIEPWADSEHPELAAKLNTHRMFIQTLIDISQMQKARFPVYPDPNSGPFMLSDMRRLTFILSWASANDLADGRIEAAYNKYQCQLKLAHQLQQQPAAYYRLVSIAIEAVASGNIKRAAMRDEITTEQLSSLETILKIPLDQDEVAAEVVYKVDQLIQRKERSELSLTARFKHWLLGRANRASQRQREQRQLLRLHANQQAIRILIALRRHKEMTGAWPGTLEQIEPKLPGQMLIDPQNNGPFVYKRDGDDFVFYSKGPNNIDEGGSYAGAADDWTIWPLKNKIIPAGEQ